MTACVGLTRAEFASLIFSLLTLTLSGAGYISGRLAGETLYGVSHNPGMSPSSPIVGMKDPVAGSPVTACNEKSLISFSKMAFVILQNILRWHSSKIPAGGANLWVGFGGLNVRCEIGGGSHQFQ